jgi:hypothetical protein
MERCKTPKVHKPTFVAPTPEEQVQTFAQKRNCTITPTAAALIVKVAKEKHTNYLEIARVVIRKYGKTVKLSHLLKSIDWRK